MSSTIFFSSICIVVVVLSAHMHSVSHEDPWNQKDAGVVSDGTAFASPSQYADAGQKKKEDETAGIFANAMSALFGSSKRDETEKKKWSWTEGATNFVKDCGNMFSRMIGWSFNNSPSRGRSGREKGREESSGARSDESELSRNKKEHKRTTTRVTRSVADAEEDKDATGAPSVTTSLYIVACYLGGWGCKNGADRESRDLGTSTQPPIGEKAERREPWYDRVGNDGSSFHSGFGSIGQQYGRSGGGSSGRGYQEISGAWGDGTGSRRIAGEEQIKRVPEGAAPSAGGDHSSGSTGHLSHAKSTWAEVTSGLPKARSSITDAAASARTGVSDAAASALTSVGQFLGQTSASASGAWDGAKEEARRLGSTVGGRVSSVSESLSASASGIGERISSKWDQFKSGTSQTLAGATRSIDEWSTEAKERASKTIGEVTSAAKGAVGEATTSVGQLGSSIGQGLTDSASNAVHSVGSSLGGAAASTREAFNGASKSVTEFGKEASSRVEGAFVSTKSAIGDAASSFGSEMQNAASTAVHEVGSTFGGAVDSLDQARASIGEFGSSASKSATTTLNRAGSSIEDAYHSSRASLGDAASTAVHGIDSTLTAAGERTKEVFSGASNSISAFGSNIGDSAAAAAHNVQSTLGDAASSVSQFGSRAGSRIEGAVDSIGEHASSAAQLASESFGDVATSIRSGFGDGIDKGSEWLSSARTSIGEFGNGVTDSLSSAATRAGEAIDSTAQEASDSSSSFFSSVSSTVSGWFSSAPTEPSPVTETPPPKEEPTGPGLISNIGSTLYNWMTREDETTPAPTEEPTTTTETPTTTTEGIPTEPPPSAFASVGSTLINWFANSAAKAGEAAETTPAPSDGGTLDATTETPATTTTEDPRPGLISNAGAAVYNWWTKETEPEATEQPKAPDGTDSASTMEPSPPNDQTTTANPEEATTAGPSTFSSVGSTIMSWFSSSSSSGGSESTTQAPDGTSESTELTPSEGGEEATTVSSPEEPIGPGFFTSIGNTVSGWFSSSSSSGITDDSTTAYPEDSSESSTGSDHEPTTEATADGSDSTTQAPDDTTGSSFLSSIGNTVSGWFSSSGGSTESATIATESTESIETTPASVDEATLAPEDADSTALAPEDSTGSSFLSSIDDTFSGWFSSSSKSTEPTQVPEEESSTSPSMPVEETTAAAEGADSTTTAIQEDTGPSFLMSIGDTVSGWFSSSGKSIEVTTSPVDGTESSTIASETTVPSYESTDSTTSASVDESATEPVTTEPTESSFFTSIGDTVSGWFSGGSKDVRSEPDSPQTTEPSDSTTESTTSSNVEETTPSPPDEATGPSILTSIGQTVSGWFSSSSSSTSEAPSDSLLDTSTASSTEATSTTASPVIETGSTIPSSVPGSDALAMGTGEHTASLVDSVSTITPGFDLTTTLPEPETTRQESTIPVVAGPPSNAYPSTTWPPASETPYAPATSHSIFEFTLPPQTTAPSSEENSLTTSPYSPSTSHSIFEFTMSPETATSRPEDSQYGNTDDYSISVSEITTEDPKIHEGGREETTDPSLISTIGSKITEFFSSSSSSTEQTPTATETPSVSEGMTETSSTRAPDEYQTNVEGTTQPINVDLTAPHVDGPSSESLPETTDPSLISSIGSKIGEWFSSSSSSTEQPNEATAESSEGQTPSSSITEPPVEASSPVSGDPSTTSPYSPATSYSIFEFTLPPHTSPNNNEYGSTGDNTSVAVESTPPSSISEESTFGETGAGLVDSTTPAGSTESQPDPTDPSLISSIGNTISEWFSSSSSTDQRPESETGVEDSSTPISPEEPTTSASEASTATERPPENEELTTPSPAGNEGSMSSTLDDITGHSSLVTSIGSTVANWFSSSSSGVPEASDFLKPDREETTTTNAITEDVEIPSASTEQSVLVDPYQPIVPATDPTSEASTTASPYEPSTSYSIFEFTLPPSTSTSRPDNNNEYGSTDDNTIYVTEQGGEEQTTTEDPKILVKEILEEMETSTASTSTKEEANEVKGAVEHAWSWLEQHIGNKTSDWKHLWEWMNEDQKPKQPTAVTGHTRPHEHWPWVHEQSRDSAAPHRSDRGLTHSITPQWLWDQASGSLRYARASPTPTVQGKGVCSAMVAASEFDNDERGSRRIRSPSNPIQYAGNDYYWDARFLPIIVRPQRRSICTHFITRDEMEDEVELGNGTMFSSIAWTCPPLHECCEWECCTRMGERRWILYGYFLLLFILVIVLTALTVLLCYYICVVRKKRSKTAPIPFAVYTAPPISPPTNEAAFGTHPHGTRTNPNQLYSSDSDPTSFMPPPPAYHDVQYYV